MTIRWWSFGFSFAKSKLHAFEMSGVMPAAKRAKKALCGYRMPKGSASSPDTPDKKKCCKHCQRLSETPPQ